MCPAPLTQFQAHGESGTIIPCNNTYVHIYMRDVLAFLPQQVTEGKKQVVAVAAGKRDLILVILTTQD